MAFFGGDDLFEVVLRVLVKGPGHLLARLFGGGREPSDGTCRLAFQVFGPG